MSKRIDPEDFLIKEKIILPEGDLGSKTEYWLLHGTLEGWRKPVRLDQKNNTDYQHKLKS